MSGAEVKIEDEELAIMKESDLFGMVRRRCDPLPAERPRQGGLDIETHDLE